MLAPSNWKKGNITSTFKKREKEDPGNYRPESPTSLPSKTTEQSLLEILWYTWDIEVIWDSQHSFTEGTSCLTDLAAFYDGVMTLVEK